MTLFGRFDRKTRKYEEIFEAVSGNIIISNETKTVQEIMSIYQSTKPILIDYNPREIERGIFYA